MTLPSELSEEVAEWLLVARGWSRGASSAGRRAAKLVLGGGDEDGSGMVYLTGTGTPLPAPRRAGAGTLVAFGGVKVQVDAGRGTVMRLAEVGVRCRDLTAVLVTHHHSDHLMDLADVVLTRWLEGGTSPLTVVVPEGAARVFVESITESWTADIEIRRRHGNRPRGPLMTVHSFEPGESPQRVWASESVKVSAIRAHHEPVFPAVAYRLDAEGSAIVVSGDTRACPEVQELACHADILVHEAMREEAVLAIGMPHVATYHAETSEVGALAAKAGVRTLVLTHLVPSPNRRADIAAFRRDVRRGGFKGRVVVGRDGMAVGVGRRSH